MHLLRVAGRVADSVNDSGEGPNTAEGRSHHRVLQSGNEGAREDHRDTLEGVLMGP